MASSSAAASAGFLDALDFLERAAPMRTRIEAALEVYSRYDADCPIVLRDAIRHSLLAPAKRLRPMLVLMAAESCGGGPSAMAAACAVEMVHTYSLIHDDLPAMDDDELRRGIPTCHVKYGEATAILAGDALLTQAFELLATEVRPLEVAARCCAELGRAAGASRLVGGQSDDLAAESRGGSESPEESLARLEAIHRRKTGALFVASLRLGALVADAPEPFDAALAAYGRALGLAFQIADDLLDHEGNAAALGKRARKDGDRGKLTFPALLGVESSRRRAAALIDEAVGSIESLGPQAVSLRALARYVLDRTH
ncbi:MAG: polyprenyl synthetase family protein [Planctomycetes bacterium]|nr:polyprenyl synthetase family protein [Planctomycetota bacterium]